MPCSNSVLPPATLTVEGDVRCSEFPPTTLTTSGLLKDTERALVSSNREGASTRSTCDEKERAAAAEIAPNTPE